MEGNPLFLAMKPLLGGIVELEQPKKKVEKRNGLRPKHQNITKSPHYPWA
jgi:hypothetical protein